MVGRFRMKHISSQTRSPGVALLKASWNTLSFSPISTLPTAIASGLVAEALVGGAQAWTGVDAFTSDPSVLLNLARFSRNSAASRPLFFYDILKQGN